MKQIISTFRLVNKKYFTIVTIIALISFNQLNAQEKNISVNPVGLAFGLFNVSYEKALTNNQSISISGLYFNDNTFDITGIGAEAGYNYYFSSEVIRGFHIGGNAGALFLSDANSSDTVLTLGANAGYKWVFGEHFSLDLFASGKYFTNSKLNGLDTFLPGVGLSVGYTW